ncbi:MAG: outer membrane protein assembly factor BamD [Bacteroidia bacterium]
MKNTTKYWLFAFIIFILASCSEYQKVLNSDDFNLKLETANELYENEQFTKALPLYEELRRIFLGQDQMKTILFNMAYCEFNTDQFFLAAYHFKQFYESYPYSKNAEESLFMHCKCLHTTSPKSSLDQSSSQKAINALEQFTNAFPESEHVDECNALIDEMRVKIEFKAYTTANIYYKIQDYKAAVWALGNFTREFPGSNYEEDARFLMIESSFKFAENSVRKKQEERFVETVDYFKEFKKRFPNSQYMEKAKEYSDIAKQELNNIQNN